MRKAHCEKAIGFDKRAIGIANLIGVTVGKVEAIELSAPAVWPAIAYATIEERRCRRDERAVLGKRSWTEIPKLQRAKPSRCFAKLDCR